MKRIFILLITISSLASCKKDKPNCFNCTYGTTNGVTRPPDVQCDPDGEPGPFYDALGNVIQSECTPQ